MIDIGHKPDSKIRRRERGFYKVNSSSSDMSIKQSNSLIDIDKFNYLKSRQTYIANSFTNLPKIRRTSKVPSKPKVFEQLLADLEKIDCKLLRDKLDNSGRKLHEKIQELNLKSGAVAANKRTQKMNAWRNKAFSKVVDDMLPSKKEVRGMVSQWKKEILSLNLAH